MKTEAVADEPLGLLWVFCASVVHFGFLPLLQSVWVDWTGLVGSEDLGSILLMVIS